MVDSINSSPSQSLLRAQQTANLQAASAARVPQATINQTKAAATVAVAARATPQPVKVASANSNLPRGSIVDRLV